MILEEKTLKSEKVLQGKILYVTQDTALLPNGKEALRDVVHHSGGVGVVPLTENNTVYMVKQFRYPMQEVTLEIPAGKREIGEEPLECGIRELLEETGCTAEKMTSLDLLYPTPAYDTEVIYIFLATGISKDHSQHLDEDEFADVVEIPLEEAVSKVMNGEIKDAKTQIALLKTYYMLKDKKGF